MAGFNKYHIFNFPGKPFLIMITDHQTRLESPTHNLVMADRAMGIAHCPVPSAHWAMPHWAYLLFFEISRDTNRRVKDILMVSIILPVKRLKMLYFLNTLILFVFLISADF